MTQNRREVDRIKKELDLLHKIYLRLLCELDEAEKELLSRELKELEVDDSFIWEE